MSILIKGMEMPKSCDECFVRLSLCSAVRKIAKSGGPRMWVPTTYRPDDCPLAEISQPHGRLIDADAVFNNLERTGWYDNADRDIAEDLVLDAPTIIGEEEVESCLF